MSVPKLAKEFLDQIEERFGPFDRPFQFHVFPFDAGGSLNFLTVGAGLGKKFITYISCDLFGHAKQQRSSLGRYELMTTCDNQEWCSKVLTNIGRMGLQELLAPGDTIDIGPWVGRDAALQGVVLEEAFRTELRALHRREPCGVLRCVGVTRPELEFAMRHGAPALLERLKRGGEHPQTLVQRRDSVDLSD